LRSESDEPDEDFADEIKPQDGLERYWFFLNGEQYRLFAALAAAFFAVLWCFSYILGLGRGAVQTTLLVLTGISFVAWRLLDRQWHEYAEKEWRKSKQSARKERIEIRVAAVLWLFILISVSAIMLWQWRHPR
jgi:hypothetical protein